MSPAIRVDSAPAPAPVLLVEDEVVVRALLAEEMRAAGLSVVEASNADEAWAYLTAGGVALMKRVKAAYPDMKIVITSGNLGPLDINQFDRFVQKPFSFSQAVKVASEMLGTPPEPA